MLEQPLFHCLTDRAHDIVVCFTEKPAEIFCSQIELKAVALTDNGHGVTSRCFEHRIVRQVVLLDYEPHLFICAWRDVNQMAPAIASWEMNRLSGGTKVLP